MSDALVPNCEQDRARMRNPPPSLLCPGRGPDVAALKSGDFMHLHAARVYTHTLAALTKVATRSAENNLDVNGWRAAS